LSLEELCGYFTCYFTLEERLAYEPGVCNADYQGVTFLRGCGLVALGWPGDFGGTWAIYDAQTGMLVGARTHSDYAQGPCHAFGYQAGMQMPLCDDTSMCTTCSNEDGVPVCEL
jgi:hypothetical protein